MCISHMFPVSLDNFNHLCFSQLQFTMFFSLQKPLFSLFLSLQKSMAPYTPPNDTAQDEFAV